MNSQNEKNTKKDERISSKEALLELIAKEAAKMELEKYKSLVNSNFGVDDSSEE